VPLFGLSEGSYDARTRLRNRVVIGLLFAGAIVACALGAALTDWPWSNAIGLMIVAFVVAALLWWMFASRKAGPVSLTGRSTTDLKRTFWMK